MKIGTVDEAVANVIKWEEEFAQWLKTNGATHQQALEGVTFDTFWSDVVDPESVQMYRTDRTNQDFIDGCTVCKVPASEIESLATACGHTGELGFTKEVRDFLNKENIPFIFAMVMVYDDPDEVDPRIRAWWVSFPVKNKKQARTFERLTGMGFDGDLRQGFADFESE